MTVILAGCKKKQNTTLGTDVQPATDDLVTEISDTATIQLHTIKHPVTRSYQDQFKYLGSNQDPVFGRTNASLYTNFSIAGNVNNISFGEDAVADSAEIILVFTQSFVGDTTTPLQYQVHQLTQSLGKSIIFKVDSNLSYNTNPLCNVTRRITKTSGFYTIRLPIDENFASAVITNPSYLTSSSVMQSMYKGFYITTKNTIGLNPTNKQGALMKVDLDNSVSGFYVYYHNGTSSALKQPKTYRFPFSGTDASRFNNVEYNYTSGANNLLIQQIVDKDTVKGKQNIFLKGLGGTKSVIRIPFLKNYADSCPISVNRAEVILKVDQAFLSSSNNYEPPSQISLVAIDANGNEVYIKDQYYSVDLLKFGGNYDPVNKRYVFNMARHVQDIMTGKIENHGFYIVVANTDRLLVPRRDNKAERVVFGGISNALYAPEFNLTFIRFPYDK